MFQNNYNDFIKELALKHKIDPRVCKVIIDSPFNYLKYLVTDSKEEDGLRVPFFGAFSQKGNYRNKTMRTETRKKILLDEIVDVATMMATTLGFIVPTTESAKEVIEKAWEVGDYEKINFIWKGWEEYNK